MRLISVRFRDGFQKQNLAYLFTGECILYRPIALFQNKNMLPIQPGDVPATYADVADLQSAVGFSPATPLEQGVEEFVRWYRDYYGC